MLGLFLKAPVQICTMQGMTSLHYMGNQRCAQKHKFFWEGSRFLYPEMGWCVCVCVCVCICTCIHVCVYIYNLFKKYANVVGIKEGV